MIEAKVAGSLRLMLSEFVIHNGDDLDKDASSKKKDDAEATINPPQRIYIIPTSVLMYVVMKKIPRGSGVQDIVGSYRGEEPDENGCTTAQTETGARGENSVEPKVVEEDTHAHEQAKRCANIQFVIRVD